ncbi:MAG: hypothetical protein IJ766_01185 [Clostridia bacterium]|nr:hypothetical protein [Clostridia bacterium]
MTTAWATILGAAIGAIASIIVCVINNNKQNALMLYRLEQLEQKVDKHNQVVERTYALEKSDELQTEKIKVINHRLDDLERSESHD